MTAVPCYEPEHVYNIFHWHFSLAVDIIATAESIIVVLIVFFWCNDGVTSVDKWTSTIGLSGSLLSLCSSIGGLGESTNVLVTVGDFKWGFLGFIIATATRSFPMDIAMKVWEWMKLRPPPLPPTVELNEL
jgi:hypothetical protein